MAYRIEFAQSVRAQLEALTVGQRKTLLAAIEQQLQHQPSVETRNRKRLRPNALAPWELRVGRLRALYDVVEPSDREAPSAGEPLGREQGVVQILAVGEKRGNVLRIRGKEVQL